MNFYRNHWTISRYPDTERIENLSVNFWEDAPEKSLPIDEGTSFLDQFKNLHKIVPLQPMYHIGNDSENCDFADVIMGGKNVYLSTTIMDTVENVAYSAFCYPRATDVYNSFLACQWSTNIYMSGRVTNSHNIFYSRYISDSANIWFSTNLIGCSECIGCHDLQNQKYCIGNTALEKSIYEIEKKKILQDKKKFMDFYLHITTRPMVNIASENVTGNAIIKSHNIENGGWINNMHDCRNIWIGEGGIDGSYHIYDSIDIGGRKTEDVYWWVGIGAGSTKIFCSSQITDCFSIYYSYFLDHCSYCIGCIGLMNKSYCILNKQYTKEEWEILAEKIFASMESDGTLGEFFPASMNPFYFNDTLAYLIDDSFTQEEIEAEWYLWRGEPIRADIPEGMRVVKNSELDQFQGFCSIRHPEWNEGSMGMDSSLRQNDGTRWSEWYIDPAIMNVVISDEKWNYYRIVKMEYDFLMKHALPLPTLHWLDRMKMGFQ